jgi:hypothetical protein
MEKRKVIQNLAMVRFFEIYPTLHTIFGDIIQLNKQASRNYLLRKILSMKTIICCVETFRA